MTLFQRPRWPSAARCLLSCLATAQRQLHVDIQRNPGFGQLGQDDVTFFTSCVGPSGVLQDPDVLQGYNRDWIKKYEGHSQVVVRPKTTEQVSQLLAYCNSKVSDGRELGGG